MTLKLVSNYVNIQPTTEKNSFDLYDFVSQKGGKVTLNSLKATENVLVTGATGSGKTTSVLLPMFHKLLSNNCSGLVLDVKGELWKMMSLIANKKDLAHRIKVIGLNDCASDFNILNNFTPDIFKSFLRKFSSQSEKNLYWSGMGVNNLLDLVSLEDELNKIDQKSLEQTQFVRMFDLLTDPDCSKMIHKRVAELAAREATEDSISEDVIAKVCSLFRKIKSDKFHFFNLYVSGSTDQDDLMQLTWRTDELVNTISMLKEESVTTKINSLSDKMRLDDMVFEENQIVILVGDIRRPLLSKNIASAVRNCFYTQLLSREPEDIGGTMPSFLMVDEYQYFVNFTDTADVLSDESFSSLSRSFNHINICATQSIASLYRYAENSSAVDMLLQNFVNKIFLNTDCKRNYLLAKDIFEFNGESMADTPVMSLVAQHGAKLGLCKISTEDGIEFQSFVPSANPDSMLQYCISDRFRSELLQFNRKRPAIRTCSH